MLTLGKTHLARTVTNWHTACDERLTKLVSDIFFTHISSATWFCWRQRHELLLGFFQEVSFAGCFHDSKSTLGGTLNFRPTVMDVARTQVLTEDFSFVVMGLSWETCADVDAGGMALCRFGEVCWRPLCPYRHSGKGRAARSNCFWAFSRRCLLQVVFMTLNQRLVGR